MADNKTVIEVEVKGTDAATNSLKNLRQELKAAQAAALNGDGKAAKRVAELKDKLDDLNDSTKTLKGSGVERISSSFGLLGEGLKNFDSDAIKTGFKGIGAAMSAIPIFLLIEGVKLLIENFDKVVEFVPKLLGIVDINKKNAEISQESYNTEKKKLEILNNQDNILKLQGKSEKEILQYKIEQLDATIASGKAALKAKEIELKAEEDLSIKRNDYIKTGISVTLEFSVLALRALSAPLDLVLLGINKVRKALGQEELPLINKKITEFKNQIAETVAGIFIDPEKIKKENQKILEENKSALLALENQKAGHLLTLRSLDEKNQIKNKEIAEKAKQDAAKATKDSIDKIEQDRIKAEEAKKASYEKYLEWEKAARLKRDQEEVAEFIEKENQLKKEQEAAAKRKKEYAERDFKLTKDGLASGQALSDAVFAIQASKLKKGSAESEALAKKQFQVNKAFNLATATADGYKAVISTFAATPGGVVIKSIAASIAGVFAAAQIAKIASSKFEGGGSSPAAEAPSTTSMNTAEPPTITQPMATQPTTPGTNFDAQGNVIGGQGTMKAYVVETEITNKQTTVNRLQNQAQFG